MPYPQRMSSVRALPARRGVAARLHPALPPGTLDPLRAAALDLQRRAGNRATISALEGEPGLQLQRIFGFGKKKPKREQPETTDTAKTEEEAPKTTAPYVAVIGKQQVNVANTEEEKEARAIIKMLKTTYGIEVSSSTVISAIKAQYGNVPKSETSKLEAGVWEMKELRAARDALAHFAPILGSQRKKSPLGKKSQGVTSIGRVKQAIDVNTKEGTVDNSTMGEYFGGKKTVGLFDVVTDLSDDRYVAEGSGGPDNKTTLEANGIHEMSHGLVEPVYLSSWVDKMDYWLDSFTASGEVSAEEPPTEYGHSNAKEDLAESVALYFINRPRLEAVCPMRVAFLDDMVGKWTPTKKKEALTTSAKGGSGK
jgi:hypothetical protein